MVQNYDETSSDFTLISIEPRPSRSDALKNRALILEAAKRLFARDGVEAVSMSAIADEAGVGKGTLYRHFENKGQLCETLLDENQRALQQTTFSRLAEMDTPVEKLHWFIGAVLQFVLDNRDLLIGCTEHSELSMLRHPAHYWWRQTIFGLLQQMRIPGDLNFKTDSLYVMLDMRTLRYMLNDRHYDMERIQGGLCDLINRLIS